MSNMLQVVATIVAKKGRAALVRKLLSPAVRRFRAEPGCHGYILLQDNVKPERFLTYETWQDQPALQAHMKSPAMARLMPKLKPLLKGATKQKFLTVLLDLG